MFMIHSLVVLLSAMRRSDPLTATSTLKNPAPGHLAPDDKAAPTAEGDLIEAVDLPFCL